MRMKHGFLLVMALIILAFGLMACDVPAPSKNSVAKQTRDKLRNTQNLFEKQPTPTIDWSTDRYLLSERLTRFNDPNKMNYLYVCFISGEWIQLTMVGKLASTSKRLTPSVKQYKVDKGPQYGTDLGPSPDEMGVWGHSQPAKVGMTTLGSLFEMGGMIAFIYSETPLNFKNMTSPMIEIEVSATEEEKRAFGKKLDKMRLTLPKKQ